MIREGGPETVRLFFVLQRESFLPLDSILLSAYLLRMAEIEAPVLPETEKTVESKPEVLMTKGYLVICWDDPVNLMDYVTHVFQTVFGWDRTKAEFHMLQVHREGKSVLVRETLEKAEHYVHELHKHSLQATLEPAA
jgi:ATP-dependent Clp protease adaptor protein ClpS